MLGPVRALLMVVLASTACGRVGFEFGYPVE